jgi:hypothetical protein
MEVVGEITANLLGLMDRRGTIRTSTMQTQPSPIVVLPKEFSAHPHEQLIEARRLEHRLREA